MTSSGNLETGDDQSPSRKSIKEILLQLRPKELWGLIVAFATIIALVFGLGVSYSKLTKEAKLLALDSNKTKQIELKPSEVYASGALIVELRNNEYVMLGVLHVDKERGMLISPPAGKIKGNIGESPIEAAKREIFEETGFKLMNLEFLERAPAGNPNFNLFKADIDHEFPQENYVHDGTAGIIWANPSKIPQINWRFPEQRDWIIEQFEEVARNME